MITCPACGIEVPSTAINETLKAARCPGCNALTDMGGGLVRRPSRRDTEAPLLATPERWTVSDGPGTLRASWSWFTWQAVIMIPFTLFWNGIMLAMATGLTQGWQHPERLLLGLAVPHVWVGLGLIYWTSASFLNTTTVEVKDRCLTVTHGPLPWLGSRRVEARDIEQLFVLEKHQKSTTRYELCAILANGRKQAMVTGLTGPDVARYLEVRLEAVLDLKDMPVEGEFYRRR